MSLAAIWNIARSKFNKLKILYLFYFLILGDVEVPKNAPYTFLLQKHKHYLIACGRDRDSYEYVMAEYLRMSGIYWCMAALDVLNETGEESDIEFIADFIQRNKREDGGYAAAEGHDSHLLHTLSAVQLSIIINRVDIVSQTHKQLYSYIYIQIDKEETANFVKSLQQTDGKNYVFFVFKTLIR